MTLNAQDILRIDFRKNERTPRPLNPPGADYDGRLEEDDSALYPALQQVSTITLGGSTVTTDVTTLVIVPVTMAHGSPAADGIGPFTLTFETGATQTLAAVAAGLEADATAQSTPTLEQIGAGYARIKDFMSVTSSGDDVIITTRDAGATFTWSLSSTGSVTEDSFVTTGGTSDPLPFGIIVSQKAVAADGQRQMGAPAGGAEPVLGLLVWSAKAAPRTQGDGGGTLERSADGKYRIFGSGMALTEEAVTVDGDVFYRHAITVAGDVLGAVTGTNSGDHTQLAGATFLETTTTAGRAPIDLPH